MSEKNILPQSLILENRIGIRRGIFIVLLLFLFIFLPWLMGNQELFRQEGVFAAIAAEYADGTEFAVNGVSASAHHQILRDAWPLYPAVVSLFARWFSMETALRSVSVVMLGILSLLAGINTAIRSNKRSGLVAALCCFGTLFALDKGINGGPETMAACFLLAAQLLFFHYGSRHADWNSAWIASAIFLSLGFLTIGPVVILFFVFPLLFLRRPLSFSGKFRSPGFLAGFILLLSTVIGWLLPLGLDWRHYAYSSGVEIVPLADYLCNVLSFPFIFPVRMMPWSLVMWLPFCVALQAISPVPVFSRYLRTLFFANLALVWLLPGASSSLIFFLIGPLSILTGLNYDLGVRRYGGFLRRVLLAGGMVFPILILLLLFVVFLPDRYLGIFGNVGKLKFRESIQYFYFALSGIGILTALGVFFCCGRKRFPVWVQILLLSFGIGVISSTVSLPLRMMENDWRKFGTDVRNALPSDAQRIFKYKIDGMYCGLFYVGVPVYTLEDLARLESLEDTVYLVSAAAPVYPDRVWTPLLPAGYKCRGVEVTLWRGERPLDEESIPENEDE